jgi:hypothetical protein
MAARPNTAVTPAYHRWLKPAHLADSYTGLKIVERDGISFIAMELIDGRRLSEVLEGRPWLRECFECRSRGASGPDHQGERRLPALVSRW